MNRYAANVLQFRNETVPAGKLYLKAGRIKVEIAVAKGKKFHDKREAIKAREMQAEAKAALARRVRQ